MKSKFIQLDQPCQEKWDNMKPNEKGSFCASCSKNVLDFTQLNEVEISEIINKSGKEFCARMTHTQLNTPLFDQGTNFEFNLPTSKVAAGLALATSLTVGQAADAQHQNVQTEIVESSDLELSSIKEESISNVSEEKSANVTVFKGNVISADLKLPVENAKITVVTAQRLLSTSTSKDGSFSIEIPTSLIDDDNVIRVSYEDVEEERESEFFVGYETKDFILSKKELTFEFLIEAEPEILYLGGMRVLTEKRKPIVLSNGVEINYREFYKARRGEKSSCSLDGKGYLYFHGDYAVAIYGRKAKDGLYILTEE